MIRDAAGARVDPQDCTLVIPAYNEERRICTLLDDVSSFPGELIFVCDGTDATADVVTAFAAMHPDLSIRCLRFAQRLGKGGGILAGMQAATGRYVGYMDADCSTRLDQMRLLFDRLGEADGAIGSRWVPGAVLVVRQSFMRRAQSRFFNLIVKVLFGLDYRDTQCGAKVFRKEALDAVSADLRATGFEFDVELLWRLRQKGYTVEEVSIVWQNMDESKVGTSDVAAMLTGMLRVRFGKG
ncbi:glycosyltransferase family 2 protein [Methanoculleus sp. FWC-SCC1]|uniref:dolichyl-phosphate beta-glucosyltransferase n=1 Tax=Methanoculleus frigidifontis TaxID=2584085 RepID=A0ABT8MCB4_9EURY|nr:dolichyl-phosphate beta-glucosyltransferase [Methanoculleus sp. FWC-SCC1]MDN7025584.1 glycosyltransferase family 2 protein [Methanoculleus sp. FWC-SCC1]